ncbi:MAG: peptidylprolyl isomerase, partial [Chlorobi bacterium]|nr:peptidylprolyl isomerase [Chlorobiota bacterium]
MNWTKAAILLLSLSIGFSCSNAENIGNKKVLISTNFGDIVVELFNETPKHRDNFIKLANEHFYDGQLFHRVMKNFMIQGGDPGSKGAEPGKRLGMGGPGYTIPAEFNPKFFHKKGALSAARQPDQMNPRKRSSGSQFFIVQGEVFTNGQLDTLEMQINYDRKQQLYKEYFNKIQAVLIKLKQEGKLDEFNITVAETRAS